jgi:hypothetical protein
MRLNEQPIAKGSGRRSIMEEGGLMRRLAWNRYRGNALDEIAQVARIVDRRGVRMPIGSVNY